MEKVISTQVSVGSLVAENFAAAEVFSKYGIPEIILLKILHTANNSIATTERKPPRYTQILFRFTPQIISVKKIKAIQKAIAIVFLTRNRRCGSYE